MNHDRRLTARYRLETMIVVDGGPGRTIDLSSGGVYFETERPMTVGQEISLVLPFEHAVHAETRVTCTGRVVRVHPRGERFGVAATYEPVAFDVPGAITNGASPRADK